MGASAGLGAGAGISGKSKPSSANAIAENASRQSQILRRPKNTHSSLLQLGLRILGHLAKFGLVQRAVRLRNLVYEKVSVQVVRFVLDAAGEKTFAIVDFLRFAVDVEEAYADLVRADDVAENFRQRKAAFVVVGGLGIIFPAG